MNKLLKVKFILGIIFLLLTIFIGKVSASGPITKTLKYGMKDIEVKYLQQTLNEKGYAIAKTGAGSKGLETTYFGNATKTAVKTYQKAKGLVADGIFGAKSRATLGSTLPPVITNYPAGCYGPSGFSTLTGARCDGKVVTPPVVRGGGSSGGGGGGNTPVTPTPDPSPVVDSPVVPPVIPPVVVPPVTPPPANTDNTYYISNSSGNDANDGLTESTPWKTIAKVNSATFQPGDNVLFKRGDTWNEQLNIINLNGNQNNYITLSAYGSGAKPIITSMQIVPGSNDPSRWKSIGNNTWEMTFSPNWMKYSGKNDRIFRLWLNEQEYCRTWDRDKIFDNDKAQLLDFWVAVNPGEWTNTPDATYRWKFGRSDIWNGTPKLKVYTPNGGNPANEYQKIEYSMIPRNPAIIETSSYFIIDNLDVRGGFDGVMIIAGSHDFIIQNSAIGKDVTRHGLRLRSTTKSNIQNSIPSYNIEVKNNVFDKGFNLYCPARSDTDSEGLDIEWDINNVSVHDNLFQDWSSAAVRTVGNSDYSTRGPRDVYVYNNHIDGTGERYSRAFSSSGGTNSGSVDVTPENIYIYNNLMTNVSTQSQVVGRNFNIYYNIWDYVGSRPMGLKTLHHESLSDGYGQWGMIDAMSKAVDIFGEGSEVNVSTRIFNNVFNEVSDVAIYQDSGFKNSFIANNLIINAGKRRRVAFDSSNSWSFAIRVRYANNKMRQFLNNYIWVDKTKYPSANDEYIAYGDKDVLPYPGYLMTIDEWNNANGKYGDTIIGNKLLSESMSSVINSDFTLPAGSPAINAGVDISAFVPAGFKDRNGNLVNRTNPSVGAFEYQSVSSLDNINLLANTSNTDGMLTDLSNKIIELSSNVYNFLAFYIVSLITSIF